MPTDAAYWYYRYTAGTGGGPTFRVPRIKGQGRDEALWSALRESLARPGFAGQLADFVDRPETRKGLTCEAAKTILRAIDVIDGQQKAFVTPESRCLAAWILRHDLPWRARLYYDCCGALGIDLAEGRYEPDSPL